MAAKADNLEKIMMSKLGAGWSETVTPIGELDDYHETFVLYYRRGARYYFKSPFRKLSFESSEPLGLKNGESYVIKIN